jgi:putative hemolysin
LAHWLTAHFPLRGGAAQISATALVVVIITFLTIIFGELVPKRLGQMYPEHGGAPGGAADELAVHRHAAFGGAAQRQHQAVLRLLGIRETGARA